MLKKKFIAMALAISLISSECWVLSAEPRYLCFSGLSTQNSALPSFASQALALKSNVTPEHSSSDRTSRMNEEIARLLRTDLGAVKGEGPEAPKQLSDISLQMRKLNAMHPVDFMPRRPPPKGIFLATFDMSGGGTRIPESLNVIRYRKNIPGLGFVAFLETSEFVLLEVPKEGGAAIYASLHVNCHVLTVRARRGDNFVIGHAHLYGGDGPDDLSAQQQFGWVLNQLTEKFDLQDIQITLWIEKAWDGFQPGTNLEILRTKAKEKGVRVTFARIREDIPMDNPVANALTTKDFTVVEERPDGADFKFDYPQYVYPAIQWSTPIALDQVSPSPIAPEMHGAQAPAVSDRTVRLAILAAVFGRELSDAEQFDAVYQVLLEHRPELARKLATLRSRIPVMHLAPLDKPEIPGVSRQDQELLSAAFDPEMIYEETLSASHRALQWVDRFQKLGVLQARHHTISSELLKQALASNVRPSFLNEDILAKALSDFYYLFTGLRGQPTVSPWRLEKQFPFAEQVFQVIGRRLDKNLPIDEQTILDALGEESSHENLAFITRAKEIIKFVPTAPETHGAQAPAAPTPQAATKLLLPLIKSAASSDASLRVLEEQGFSVYRYAHTMADRPQELSEDAFRRFAVKLGLYITEDQKGFAHNLDRMRIEFATNIISYGRDGVVVIGRQGNALFVYAYDDGEGIENLDGVMARTVKSKGGRFSGGGYGLFGIRTGVLSEGGTFSIESRKHGLRRVRIWAQAFEQYERATSRGA